MSLKIKEKTPAYLYIRMSNDAQVNGDSERRQRDLGQRFAETRDLTIIDELKDMGVSAYRGLNRAEGAFGSFITRLENKLIEPGSYLLVENLDRVSRENPFAALQVLLSIIEKDIKIGITANNHVFEKEDSSITSLMLALLPMQRGHDESRVKSQRLKQAWENKRSKLTTTKMTKHCPAWLKLSPCRTKYDVVPEHARVVQEIYADCENGLGQFAITRKLNGKKTPTFQTSVGWYDSYIEKILSNPAVMGTFQPHRKEGRKRVPVGDPIENYFPVVIQPSQFYKVQNIRKQRNRKGGRKGSNVSNIFSGLLTCAYCKSHMYYLNKGSTPKGHQYIVCDNVRRNIGCVGKAWRYDHLEMSLLSSVKELDLLSLFSNSEVSEKAAALTKEIDSCQVESHKCRAKISKLIEFVVDDPDPSVTLINTLKDLEKTATSLELKVKMLTEEKLEITNATRRTEENAHDTKLLIERIHSKDGSYADRSVVAERLKDLIEELQVGSSGMLDTTKPGIVRFTNTQRFYVMFLRDGSSRMVLPLEDDPTVNAFNMLVTPDEGLAAKGNRNGNEEIFSMSGLLKIASLIDEAQAGKSKAFKLKVAGTDIEFDPFDENGEWIDGLSKLSDGSIK